MEPQDNIVYVGSANVGTNWIIRRITSDNDVIEESTASFRNNPDYPTYVAAWKHRNELKYTSCFRDTVSEGK